MSLPNVFKEDSSRNYFMKLFRVFSDQIIIDFRDRVSVFIHDFERANFNDYHQECEAFVKDLNSAFKTSFHIKKKTMFI